MKISKAALVALGAAFTFGASSVLADTLKISHIRPQGTVHDSNIKELTNAVTSEADSLEFNIFAANALGDYTTVQERVAVGAVEMALQPISSSSDRKLQIGLLPYLAANWDEAEEIFRPGSEMREVIGDLYSKQNIKVLAGYPVYFGGIALNKEPINVNDASGDKGGLKLRVPPFKTFSLLAESLGYISAPLPFSETFTSVQTGVVDGAIGAGAEGYYNSLLDVTEYYIPQNTHFEMWYLLINKDVFNGLSDKEKSALTTAAENFEASRWDKAEAAQEESEKKLAEAGTVIVDVSEDLLTESANVARQQVWPEIVSDMGEDWAAPILNSAVGFTSEK